VGRVVALGWACLDHRFRVARFPPAGARTEASHHQSDIGGPAAVAALTVACLGGRAALISRRGDDAAGETMARRLEAAGVDISGFAPSAGARSATTAVLVAPDGERFMFPYRGERLAGHVPLTLLEAGGVVLCDLRWLDGALTLAKAARARGLRVVVDLDRDLPEAWALVGHATHAIADEELGVAMGGIDSLLGRIADLGAFGAVTLGAKGVIWPGGRLEAFRVSVRDTTGAGDVFHGAFALALADGMDEPAALRYAAAAAAIRCQTADIPRPDLVRALLENSHVQARAR
jgi:sulfofructose kinase